MRLSLRVEFDDCDMTRQCQDLETLSSFAIFCRVPIKQNTQPTDYVIITYFFRDFLVTKKMTVI